jgi:hypothetical protein
MLFDLRSRNRRAAVRVIYILLAVVMAGGLIFAGVGTGVGGGLLNAFENNGSGSNSSQSLVAKQVKTAQRETQKNPSSTQAWIDLMQARLEQAQSQQPAYYNSSTGVYTAKGKAILQQGISAWDQYLKAAGGNPTATGASLAKTLFVGTKDYKGLAMAYQYIIKLQPKAAGGYLCLALSAYASGNKGLGDLAATKAEALTAKVDRLTTKSALASARKTKSTAEQYVSSEC